MRHCGLRHSGANVKIMTSLIVAAFLLSGCANNTGISHEDSAGSVKREGGPVLCKDGSTPPCNDRD
jgi:hypothetical protein